jgi:hypothetical protein
MVRAPQLASVAQLVKARSAGIGYRSYSTRVSGITVLLYTQGLNSHTLLSGYFQYFSILFMFLSSLFRPIIFSKIYIFNHLKF